MTEAPYVKAGPSLELNTVANILLTHTESMPLRQRYLLANLTLKALADAGFALVPVAELHAHADGNTGEGCWDLHDKYAADRAETDA